MGCKWKATLCKQWITDNLILLGHFVPNTAPTTSFTFSALKPQGENNWHETPKAMKSPIWLCKQSCWEQDFGSSDLLSSLLTQVSLHSSIRGSIKVMGVLLGIKSHCGKGMELTSPVWFLHRYLWKKDPEIPHHRQNNATTSSNKTATPDNILKTDTKFSSTLKVHVQ